MKSLKLLALIGSLFASAPLRAQTAGGAWRVDGTVAGRTFKLNCQIQGGGTCVDPSGKRYALTSAATTGDQATWAFQTKVAFIGVTLTFSGRAAGNRMTGTIRAAGRTGNFTAVRR